MEKRLGHRLERAGRDERDSQKKTDHIGIYRQKQQGLNYVGLLVPVGRITAEQLLEVSRLSEEYGTGEVRLTPTQNLILPNILDKRVGNLIEEKLLKDLTYNPSEIMRGLVSCTGIEYCNLAVIETKNRALSIAQRMEKKIGATRPVEIRWSGCPAGCGNHTVADIGLLGKKIKVDGQVMDGVDIFVGGRSGPHARQGLKVLEDIPCDRLEEVLEGLARYVVREKGVEMVKGERSNSLEVQSDRHSEKWIKVGKVDHFSDGATRVVEIAGRTVAVFQVDGAFYAIDSVCPHAGGSLGQGKVDGMEVICPLHEYRFDIRDGHCSTDPSCKAVTYKISQQGGDLMVEVPREEQIVT